MSNETTNAQLNNEIERKKALNRERVAKCRAKKKAQAENLTVNSYQAIASRFNQLAANYGVEAMLGGFQKTLGAFANQPQIQNARVKGLSSLPVDYTKEEIGDFLRNPYQSERQLRQTSEVLRWTAYPYFKMGKTYQDIPTYRYYSMPLYIKKEQAKSQEFLREAILVDKLNKKMCPESVLHKITGEAINQGKVFYTPRVKVDKAHNKVEYAFLQKLPSDYCLITSRNSLSGISIAFNLMYFMQMGVSPYDYGDLFTPYLDDFNAMFNPPKNKKAKKVVYSSKNGTTFDYYPDNVRTNAEGSPLSMVINSVAYYYIFLPAERVWCFEIDDTTPAVASPLSGMMLTYSQQSDFEAAQLALVLNPLAMVLTGEIPYFTDNGSTIEDGIRLSLGAREMFQSFFDNLMRANNTGGVGLYTAPVNNIKSHKFENSANSNEVSESFNRYATEKGGLGALVPMGDIKASQVEASKRIESEFTSCVQRQFERLMNYLYETLNLKHEWRFTMFGSIFNDQEIRENAEKSIANGDISEYFILSALDRQSWIDKISMANIIKESGLLEMLTPPPTSYTQSTNEGGRPRTEKISDSKEKAIDSGVTNAD